MSRPLARKVGVGLVVTGVLLVLVWAGRTAYAGVDLIGQLKTMKALASSDISVADPLAVTTVLRRTQRDVDVLQQEVGWLLPAATRLRWLPKVGPLLSEAPVLLALGNDLTDLGVLLWDDAAPILIRYRQGESWQRLLPDLLAALGDGIELKQDLADRALAQFERLDVEAIPSSMRQYVDLLGKGLPFLVDGLKVVEVAPSLLGYDSPKTYLVLALNEDELRPGGGFITGVGEVRVVAGDVASMEFRDSYAVDDFSTPYPDPPEALRQFMGIDLWGFRDSNWSPDFPRSARLAIELYRPGIPGDVAGVIAVDQTAVGMLVGGIGALHVEGVESPVTGATVVDYMRSAWAPVDGILDAEWWIGRKQFIGQLADAGIQRLRAGDLDSVPFIRAVLAALDQRHIQVLLLDPAAAGVLSSRGWDGSLESSTGDIIALVEANVGYNKASASVHRQYDYRIDLRDPSPRAELVLRYHHLVQLEQLCVPEVRYDADYVQMTRRCYWGHLRLFVPSEAELVEASLSPIDAGSIVSHNAWDGVAKVRSELGYTVFEQALLLPTAAQRELRFRYLLPPTIVRRMEDGTYEYRLTVRKQAGLAELAGYLTLLLPHNAVLLSDNAGCKATGNLDVACEFYSNTDVTFLFRFSVPEAFP